MATVCLLPFAPLEQSQAQLFIQINPLQGDNNRTVWTFTGSSIASRDDTIPTISVGSTGFGSYASLYNYGAPASGLLNANDQLITSGNLPALFADYALSFSTNVNFQPRITISNNTQTISHITLVNSAGLDSVGIRVSGSSAISYNTNAPVSWRGRGILPYSITNLTTTAAGEYFYNAGSGPYFAAVGTRGTPSSSGFRVAVSTTPVVPEPEEYALVFGLFALGFVILRRYFQKKHRQQAAPTS